MGHCVRCGGGETAPQDHHQQRTTTTVRSDYDHQESRSLAMALSSEILFPGKIAST